MPLDPANPRKQPPGKALPGLWPDLATPPALGEPDPPPSPDQLHGEQHRNHLEGVGHAAGWERQRGHREQQHEENSEALRLEDVDQAADGLRSPPAQPSLELVAELHARVRESATRFMAKPSLHRRGSLLLLAL